MQLVYGDDVQDEDARLMLSGFGKLGGGCLSSLAAIPKLHREQQVLRRKDVPYRSVPWPRRSCCGSLCPTPSEAPRLAEKKSS